MKCNSCGHENPNVNRFCGMCGSILDRRLLTQNDVQNGVQSDAPITVQSGARSELKPGVQPGLPGVRSEVKSELKSGVQPTAGARPPVGVTEAPRRPIGTMLEPAATALKQPLAARPTQATSVSPPDRTPTRTASQEPKPVAQSSTFSMFGATHELTDSREQLHGPSFLGLSGDQDDPDYLLEDEETGSGRKWVVFLVVVVLIALGVWQWQGTSGVRAWGARALAAIGLGTGGAPQSGPPVNEPVASRTEEPAPAGEQKPPQKDDQKKDDAQAASPATGSATTAANPAQTSADTASAPSATSDKPEPAKVAAEEQPAEKKPAAARNVPANEKRSAAHAKASSAVAPEPRDDSGDELVARAQDYLYGRGGRRNCDQAMALLTSAAGQGNARASGQLGAMYATGNCAPFDRAIAYRYLTRAATAEPRNAWLRQNRDMVWREMTPDERSRASR